MTLLDRLIEFATQNTSIVPSLHNVQVLASRIDAADLAAWSKRELTGFGSQDDIPAYRGPFRTDVYVRYRYTYAGLSDDADVMWPLRPEVFADEVRQSTIMRLYDVTFTEPIQAVEDMCGKNNTLVSPWSAGAVEIVNTLIQLDGLIIKPGYTVAEAENRFNSSLALGVVDSVRSRILGLALGLERLAPNAGEPDGPRAVTAAMQEVIAKTITSTNSS